jgi:hypothetical protein
VFLALLGTLFLTGAAIQTAHASTVAESITLTVFKGGAPATFSISGCGTTSTNSSLVADGYAHSYTDITASCSITIKQPLPGDTSQYVFNSSAPTFSFTSSSSPKRITTYEQLKNEWQASPSNANWDSDLSLPMTGTVAGVSATVCSIPPPGGGSSTASCSGWSDYSDAVSAGSSTASSNIQWACYGTCSDTPTSGGNTYPSSSSYFTYYKQVGEDFSYSIADGGSGYSAPTLTCYQGGVFSSCATLTTSATFYWLDYGSQWSATNPLSGPGSSQRWTSDSASGTATAGGQVTVAYYHQYDVSVRYSVVGGGSPPGPTVAYLSYGSISSEAVAATGSSFWMDSGQSFTFSGSQAGTGERWASPNTSYQVSGAGPFTITLYNQYALGLSYEVVGGGSGYLPPTLNYSSFDKPASVNLSTSTAVFWADAESGWSATNPLPGSGASERWQTDKATNGTSTGSALITLSYYNQYLMAFGYSVTDGETGYGSPSVSFTQFGSAYRSNLTTTATTAYWLDSGQAWSVTKALGGSGPTERWATQTASGTVSETSPTKAGGSLVFTYYNQLALVYSYAIGGGGSPTAPGLSCTQFGGVNASSLTTSAATYWCDNTHTWTVSPNPLTGSSTTERWESSLTLTGTVVATVATVFTFYNQYSFTLSYSVTDGGSPKTPTLTATQFGSAYTPTLTTTATAYWLDSGQAWSVTNPLGGSTHEERWITNSSAMGTAAGPLSEDLAYLHQYYVDSGPTSVLGGSVRNVTQWYKSGTRVTLNATESDGWRFTYWKGAGSGSYNGTEPAPLMSIDGPANETAIFYAGLTIRSNTNGYVTYSFGSVSRNVSAGTASTVYVPPGTNVSLKATPGSFAYVFGTWAGATKGDNPETTLVVSGPQSVSASFALDYADIDVVAITIPLVVVLATYILAVRRWPRGQA